MTPFWKLSAAGFAATAISFGPARMGFGLFLPDIGSSLGISTGTAGLISGLGFFGFLLGLLAAAGLTARAGPRPAVVIGLNAATLGLGIVAGARDPSILALGVFFAMSSAGLAWTPFNNAVHRHVAEERRSGALSIVSTGTSLGVAAAGATALGLSLHEGSWRSGWIVFALASGLAALANWAALRDARGSREARPAGRWTVLVQGPAFPLHAIALSFGITTAIYISFAADRIARAGGISGLPAEASPAIVFVCYGTFGLVGLATGRAKASLGMPALLGLLLWTSALSLLLVALAPNWGPGVVLSAGLQGVYVMMMSAILASWSDRLFPALPSLSFCAALLSVAAGNVVGPVAAGFAADAVGTGAMFLGAAAVSAATALTGLPRHASERPVAA